MDEPGGDGRDEIPWNPPDNRKSDPKDGIQNRLDFRDGVRNRLQALKCEASSCEV